MEFSNEGNKVIAGFQNGTIRAYPLERDEGEVFKLSMLNSFWEMSMHDNDTGKSPV